MPRRRPRLFMLAALLLILPSCRDSRPDRQRLVLITLDTLRYDSFAGAGERPSGMPRTLARARQGLLFERAYSATSTTEPSHSSLLTGHHPCPLPPSLRVRRRLPGPGSRPAVPAPGSPAA